MPSSNHTYRIHLFSLCYLAAMVSYAATTTMMFSLYERNDIGVLALVNSMFGFIGFGPTNMIVLHILRKVNLKRALTIAFCGLLLTDLNISFTVFAIEEDIPVISSPIVLYPINILCCFIGGVSNSMIW